MRTLFKKFGSSFLLIGLFLFLSVLVVGFQTLYEGRLANANFSYSAGKSEAGYVQIITGEKFTVDFAFTIEKDLRDVLLEIQNGQWNINNIFLEDTAVQVKNGLAASRVVFHFQTENDIKPGSYDLIIAAKDVSSGRILQEGRIPFAVDMFTVISNCSC